MQPAFEIHRGIGLREILPDAQFCGAADIRVQSCSSDPAQCQPGDTFVALTGAETDGHEQVFEALQRGAVSVVAEQMLPVRVPSCVVEDSREAFGQICHRLAGSPGERLRVVGVTGTHGKSTTCHLVSAVLQAAGHNVGISTSLGRSGPRQAMSSQRTTPTAAELAHWLAGVEGRGGAYAIVEASSRGLAERRLAGLSLDTAVLTNVRCAHLDLHGTLANYRAAKMRLIDQLKPAGCAVVNLDDPSSRRLLRVRCPVITIGRQAAADVTATIVERHRSEQTFLISAGNETIPVRTEMIGDHHVTNCLAATAVGLLHGLPLTSIVRGLESIKRLPGRLDRIECGQPFGVYVDAADAPDRLAVCLQALRRVTTGRLLCVFSGQTLGRADERPLLGRVVERGADVGIITAAASDQRERSEIVHDILDGYERPARAHVIPSRPVAIRWALQHAQPGDSVLIAGTHELGTGRRSRSADFEVAKRWLSDTTEDEPVVIPFPTT